MSTVLTSLLGLFLILPVGWTLLRSPQRNLYIFCCAAITMNGVMLGVAGQLLPWYPYTGAAFFAVLIVALVAESIDRVRTSSLRKTGAVVVLVATVVFLAPTLSASPLLGAYRGWVVAGEQLNNVMAGILNAIDGRHKDVGVVLINVPSHFRENGSEYRVTRSAAILWPYSLQPWLDSHGIDNPVVLLGTSSHVGEIRVPRAEITNAGTLRVYFDSPDSVYSAEEFTWPPERLRKKRFLTFIYDGAKFQRFESANAATSHY